MQSAIRRVVAALALLAITPSTAAMADNPPRSSGMESAPITTTHSTAHAPAAEELARQFSITATRLGMDGLAYTVISNGTVIEQRSLAISKDRPLSTSDTLRIASVTKALTGVILMQLAEEGALDLDAQVRTLLPGSSVPRGVTIRHLAAHVSETEPGSGFVYATQRYAMLEAVIEEVTGQPFAQTLMERITEPAGMTWHESPFLGSHAGMVSSVDDIAKFAIALQENELLGTGALEQLATPFTLSGGTPGPVSLGFFVQEIGGEKILWSFGQDDPDHSSALFMFMPDRQLALFLMANTDTLSNPFRLLMGDLRTSPFAHAFLGVYAPEAASHIDPLDRALADILVDAWAGDYSAAGEAFEHLKSTSPAAFADPDRLVLHFVATSLEQEAGDLVDQLDRLILQKQPSNRWALLSSAEYLARTGRDALAMSRFQTIIDLPNQEDDFLRRLFLAWSLGGQGKIVAHEDRAKAQALFEAALATGVVGQTREELIKLRDASSSP